MMSFGEAVDSSMQTIDALSSRRLLALLALALGNPGLAGDCDVPFAVGQAQQVLIDAARGDREVPVRVFYPAILAGAATPAVSGCGFPLLAFGHGFTIANSAYGDLAQALAAQGFIVALPGSEGGLSPDHAEFGRDLRFVVDALAASAQWTAAVGDRRAIGGHSMGGGAAVLAVAAGTGIDALFALAPADTQPSAITAAASVSAPTLLITGSRDCVTPSDQHALPILAALATPAEHKLRVDIAGASHCQFSGGSLTCSIGEASCGGGATIGASYQQQQTLAILIPWLQQQLTPSQALLADGFE